MDKPSIRTVPDRESTQYLLKEKKVRSVCLKKSPVYEINNCAKKAPDLFKETQVGFTLI